MAILFSVSRFCLMLCFVLLCLFFGRFLGWAYSINRVILCLYIFSISNKKEVQLYLFLQVQGGLFRQKKRISGRLESTPKLIELKHFKKSNSSRNDTINAVEGSDEMNQ